jgi:tRNA G18 (ribose-2'-O)-methylase SpoU
MADSTHPQDARFGSKEPPSIRYGAKALRVMQVPQKDREKVKRNPVYIILDNVLDTYNIGAVFRLADAVSCEKVYICGESETPPNHRIKKASINTTEWVPWEYHSSAKSAIDDLRLKIKDIQIVAIEQSEKSVPYTAVEYAFPVALVVGHETDGVSKETMDASDVIVEIPMWGVNKSMNVMVSLAIVLFEVMKKFPPDA